MFLISGALAFDRRQLARLLLAVIISFSTTTAPGRSADVESLFPEALQALHGDGAPRDERKALRLLKEAGQAGSLPAINELGLCYQQGIGMPFRKPRAGFRLLLEAAEQGYGPAMFNVAQAYLSGNGTDRNPEAALRWLERAAQSDLVAELPPQEAHLLVQLRLQTLTDVATQALSKGDDAMAYTYWNRGAQLGDLSSQLNAARMQALGRGTDADLTSANERLEMARHQVSTRLRWMTGVRRSAELLADAEAYLLERDAAEQSAALVESMRVMIAQELTGDGTDPEKAANGAVWFRLAAEAGSPMSAARLGLLFLEGHEHLVGEEEAVTFLKQAAEKEVWIAQHGLGVYFSTVEKDGESARLWFQRAAESGFFAAAKALHNADYRRPILFPENLALAQSAARNGDPQGTFYLGLYHWIGMGVDEDPAMAARLFAQAAKADLPIALHYEGLSFLAGRGHPGAALSFTEAAVKNFQRAAKRGYAPSYTILGRLAELGATAGSHQAAEQHYRAALALEPRTEAEFHLAELLLRQGKQDLATHEIRSLLTAAAEGGSVAAMVQLAELLRQGALSPQTPTEAENWYRKALEAGEDPTALHGLAQLILARQDDPRIEQEALGYFVRAALNGHLDAARYVAQAYRNGTAGATYRPAVAARFFQILVDNKDYTHAVDLCRMLVAAESYEDLEERLETALRQKWPLEEAAVAFFRAYLQLHDRTANATSRHEGFTQMLAAARAGFPDAQAYVLEQAIDDTSPHPAVLAIWWKIDPQNSPEAYYFKGRLAYEHAHLFDEATPEDGLVMMETAAEAGSINAMCYLDDLRQKSVTGAPSVERLQAWLQRYAERGFEDAISRLESISNERNDPEPPSRRESANSGSYEKGIALKAN